MCLIHTSKEDESKSLDKIARTKKSSSSKRKEERKERNFHNKEKN